MDKSSSNDRSMHWERTKLLTVITLIIWAFFSFEIHSWGDALNGGNFPGAYFMAGMGAQVVFAVLIFWYASRQDTIDRESGVNE